MARRLVEAQYEYNWNPLVGSLVGALRAIGREVDSAVVCALSGVAGAPPPVPTEPVEGVWFEPQPDPLELPGRLAEGLAALGVEIEVTRRDEPPAGLSWRLLRRRLRGDLAAGRPIVAAGAGLDPFGPTFGLIVGFDDDRRAWRRDGQMTDQVGPWLPYDELQSSVPLVIIRVGATVESAVEQESEGAAFAAGHGGHCGCCDRCGIGGRHRALDLDPGRRRPDRAAGPRARGADLRCSARRGRDLLAWLRSRWARSRPRRRPSPSASHASPRCFPTRWAGRPTHAAFDRPGRRFCATRSPRSSVDRLVQR